jgi:class 3 adenylate cyclase/tetratricopeptide (TPR) repeat protein
LVGNLVIMATSACATCGRPVPSEARFCPSCGRPVGRSTVAAEERRVVTVLFADIVGYTSFAEHLDPEKVKRLVETCFGRLVADIEEYGGVVDKVLGDAIVALFGAPVAHEDDAERAVRAGLAMQATLGRVAAERETLDAAAAAPIEMRVGINTGEVLVGSMSGSDYTAMGDVVNTAARLQALAPPGGVLVGEATAALCSAAIDREPFGATGIRGRQQSEQPWMITGAAAAGTRPVRADLAFVGRVNERTLLASAIDLVRHGRGGVVSIVGEAGSGKTRLATELIDPLQADAIVVRAACAPYGQSDVWAPLTSGLRQLLQLDPDADLEDVQRAVDKRSSELWGLASGSAESDRFLTVIAHLFGHPSELDRLDAAGARDAVAGALTEMMRRHAAQRFTVLWIDNLQWADPMLRDQLSVLARSLADLPFLLVTGQRPDDDIVWPPPLERPLVVRVPLGPLSRDDAAALVSAIIDGEEDKADISDGAFDALVDRGGGNPLYLVELAALAARCDTTSDLPASLRALIAARLDQLTAAQRAIVDNAAVLGASDAISSLERFARSMHQDFDHADLAELVAEGVLDVDGKLWRFRSDVVRDVAYQTLTKRTRAQRHAGVASVVRAEKPHHFDALAHHAAAAAELRAELGPVEGVPASIADTAVAALLQAATEAVDTTRFELAIRHTSRALDLHRADRETERELLLVRCTAEAERRAFAEATSDAERALESAQEDDHEVHEGEARRRIGTIAQLQGDLARARQEHDIAIELFRRLDDRPRLANSLRERGFAEVFGGSLPAARRHLDEAMELYHTIDDPRGHAWTHQRLAWVAFQAGDYADAEQQLLEAQEIFDSLGDRGGVSWAAGLRAWVSYFQRRFDEAESIALSVEAEARRWGDTWPSLMMQTLLANLRLWTGRLADAEQFSERALNGFRAMDDRYGIMQALAPLNRARVAIGKKADVRRGVEESIALGHTFGELSMALQGAAGVAMHQGAAAQAFQLAEQVLERHRKSGTADHEAMVLLALAHCQNGDVDAAVAAIEDVDVSDFPFGRGARAVIRAVAGDVEAAVGDAAAVEEARAASYFDLALGRLGAVIAAERAGDDRARDEWLERFTTLATSVGDVVLVDIVHALTDVESEAVGSEAGPGDSGESGWRRLLAVAAVT